MKEEVANMKTRAPKAAVAIDQRRQNLRDRAQRGLAVIDVMVIAVVVFLVAVILIAALIVHPASKH